MRPLKLANATDTPGTCPHCGSPIDQASGLVDKNARNELKPKPGDISLCIICAGLSRYTETMTLRKLTEIEAVDCAADPRVVRARDAILAIRGKPQ
jgi:hypothetical protein